MSEGITETPGSPATDEVIQLPKPQSIQLAPQPAPAWFHSFDRFLLLLLLILAFFLGSFAATNSDVWMQLASGRMIASGEWSVGHDPFSVATEATETQEEVPWIHHSWLYSVLFYFLYNLIGGSGLVVLKALAVVALVYFLTRLRTPDGSLALSIFFVTLAALALSPRLLLQPTVVSFLFLGLTMLILHRAGALGEVDGPEPRRLWWLPPLFALWANVDAFFIMGPLAVLLVWAGTGLGNLLGIKSAVPDKSLAAVLGVGLVACVFNPHHIRVFQLPGELAYLLVRFVDLPDALVAGGRTLQRLRVDPLYRSAILSPISGEYWTTAGWGGLSGWTYIGLLALGALSFVGAALSTKRPGARGLHPGRFTLWLFLAFLSLMQARLIPYFAVVAGPITALNVADLLAWRRNQDSVRMPAWQGAKFGRLVLITAFLALLALAWPGWLHGRAGDFGSSRRVAWRIDADFSQREAAESLAASANGRRTRVFNFSPDFANYCAWFAPEAKCFLDYRWPLFSRNAATFLETRKSLLNEARDTPAIDPGKGGLNWSDTFAKFNIDHVAIGNYQVRQEVTSHVLAIWFWTKANRFRQSYGDGKTLVFSVGPPGAKGQNSQYRDELNRRAFAPAAEEEKLPSEGIVFPHEQPSLWRLYTSGKSKPAPAGYEVNQLKAYLEVTSQLWQEPYVHARMVTSWAEVAGLGSVSAGTVAGPYHFLAMTQLPAMVYNLRFESQRPFLRAADMGPPAVPLLMVRSARRAIAENPYDPNAYMSLATAYQTTMGDLEEPWSNYGGGPRPSFRLMIRQVQIVTAMKTYVALEPSDYEAHIMLANLYRQQHFLDAAKEHFRLAAHALNSLKPDTTDAMILDEFKNRRRAINEQLKFIEGDVKKRYDDYALQAVGKKGLEKFFIANYLPYTVLDAKNKEQRDMRGRGLALEALEQLQKTDPSKLNPGEQAEVAYRQLRLLITLGRSAEIIEVMPSVAKLLGPRYHELRALAAAAFGDYRGFDEAMVEIEKGLNVDEATEDLRSIIAWSAGFGQLDQLPALAKSYLYLLHRYYLNTSAARLEKTWGHAGEYRLLRGLAALEQGDITRAKQLLEEALRIARPDTDFPERPIAERYLYFLNKKW